MDLGFHGRVVVVTGGSSGIGLACVTALLAEGAVVATCARDRKRLGAATASFDQHRCFAMAADVRDPDAMADFAAATMSRFGRLDGVAAIAGHGIHGRALSLSPDQWNDEVAGKIHSVLNIVRASRPHLEKSDAGRIVTLTAPAARDPDPEMAAVSAARAAVANLSRGLALELADQGIAVNSIAVGLIDTARQHDRHQNVAPDQPYDQWLQAEAARRAVPLGRAGQPNEVARLVVLALSPVLSYTTGSVLDATGGLAAG